MCHRWRELDRCLDVGQFGLRLLNHIGWASHILSNGKLGFPRVGTKPARAIPDTNKREKTDGAIAIF